MAAIKTANLVVKMSKIVKDSEVNSPIVIEEYMSPDMITQVETILSELVNDGVLVEVNITNDEVN